MERYIDKKFVEFKGGVIQLFKDFEGRLDKRDKKA